MQKPLEATLAALEKTIEETSFEVIENRYQTPNPSTETLDKIREKIKAARLEKIMARQLANELSASPIPKRIAENVAASSSLEADFDKYKQEEIDPRNEALIETIDNTSQTLNDFLAEMEGGQASSENATNAGEEFAIIESQTKQIELLEFLRDKEAGQAEKLRRAILQLEKLAEAQSQTLQQNRLELSKLGEKAQSLSEENIVLKRENAELNESHLVAEQAAQRLLQEKEELHPEFKKLQEKYAHLVKLNIDQQNQHEKNSMQLEADLKNIAKEIRKLKLEKSEMAQEIKANNKLVTLQDQMITTLSISESETLKI